MVFNKSIKVLRRWRPTRSVLLESKLITDEALLFESGSLAILKSSESDLIRKDYPDVDTAYAFLGVLQVGQKLSYLVLVTGCQQVGKISDGTEVYRITNTLLVPLHAVPCQHEGVAAVGKLLASGQFYFSVNSEEGSSFSLLSRAQVQGHEQLQFCWNRSLYVFLQRFGVNCKRWIIPLMCGSVLIQTVYAGDKQVKACLISRVSCERAGTRFNTRGLNDEGSVANFVESEQILYVDRSSSSFVQVRGLVPVFWDQPGIQTGTNRIRLSRGFNCSHPAFTKHFVKLLTQYGGPSLCVDLLGDRDMEPLLSESYKEHLHHLDLPGAAEYINFDYHKHCRPGHTEALESVLLPQCMEFLEMCGHYVNKDGAVLSAQSGILRINCLDCLDRSNNSEAMFGLTMLAKQLEALGLSTKSTVVTRFKQLYQQFWPQNGDNLSKLYAGTRALGSSSSASKVEKLRNSARSVQRTIVNNFMDSLKQEAIDLLLLNGYVGEVGILTRSLLSSDDLFTSFPLRQELTERWKEYTQKEKLRVCIGSWNVNGGKHIRSIALKNHSMNDWLLDAPAGKRDVAPEDYIADVYAIGFQELVGLTASNLVSTSSSNRYEWGAELQRVLSRDHEYSLLTAEQLVGVCLYIFVRPHLIPFIRDVGVSAVKTGIGGKAGNKGGVAIRFLIHSTSLCFVCSHFAAHQSKVMERNQDFAEIYRRIQFPLNQPIEGHDYVFWCGDLNYRIELPISLAKDAITKQDWDRLVRHDQLTKQRKLGKVFQGFVEGELDFAPTYKYDEFSDDYDTSEKGRVPAWCDRVLWKRKSFLSPAKDQRGITRLREDSEAFDTSGLYGWHPSTVTKVYERELSSDDPSLSWWHPGSLLHYGRAELKTSDHRPVVALLEVDVFRVDEKKREQVRSDILEKSGPADPTVVVKPIDVEFNSLNTTPLVKALHQYGDIVLVRVTDEFTLVTFKLSQSALAALSFSGEQIEGIAVDVKLKEADTVSGRNMQLFTAGQLSPDLEESEEIPDELSFAADEDNPQDSNGLEELSTDELLEDTETQSLETEDIETHSIEDNLSNNSSDSLTFDDPLPLNKPHPSSSEEDQATPDQPRPKPTRPPLPSKPERPPPPNKSKPKPNRPPLPSDHPPKRPSLPKPRSNTELVNGASSIKPRSTTESAIVDPPTTRPNRPPVPNRPPPPYMSLYPK